MKSYAPHEALLQLERSIYGYPAAGDVTLEYDPVPVGQEFVDADRRPLRQVLLNLKLLGDQGHRHGRGIAAADLPRLFIPFDRLSAPADGIDGTGLGLTLSRDLMVTMGGSLRVTSTKGLGGPSWRRCR